MSRSHETRITIDLPIEEVWRALTDPVWLARWFAPKMSVEPGPGGTVVADWGPGLEWKTTIEVWEPNRHLRLAETRDRVMSGSSVVEPLPSCRLVQDYFLEAEGGRTVLRLVHSGFGESASWDNEYEGTRSGWACCFLRMKYMLEHHSGEPVHNTMRTVSYPGDTSEAVLAKLASESPADMHILLRNPTHLCGLLPSQNGSILTYSVQTVRDGAFAYIESLVFG